MKKRIAFILFLGVLLLGAPHVVNSRTSKIIGIKARTRSISGTVTLSTSYLGRSITVDTSSGVATITVPSPSSALDGRWAKFLRNGASGVTLQVTSGSIDMAGATGTLLYNHPTTESGSSVEIEYSGSSVFVLNPQGTWVLQ